MRRAAQLTTIAVFALSVAAGVSSASGHTGAHADRAPVTIQFGEFFYRPAVATVHVGQLVRFVNVGKIAHTVADTDKRGNIRSKLIEPRPLSHGQVQAVRFKTPGVVYYVCTFHPTLMRGRIVVVR
ncbi:MAG TPA: plastocyanin/azurin family copper-binding protein [Gaiellaceae bacterium]|jgi:plastocyanin